MSSPADWAKGYARQAEADFATWGILQAEDAVPECHKLLFLQMACEKLCKAHLIARNTAPETLQASHGYIARPLPIVVREQIIFSRRDLAGMRRVLQDARHLPEEIEVLNPAVDRNGQRRDNCEYPWEDHAGNVHSPLDWTFHPSNLLTAPSGRTFLKLVRAAINRLLVS
jgi:hypothetical protein